MKKIIKPVLMAVLATTVLVSGFSPAYAKSRNDFDIYLSSNKASEKASIDFEIKIKNDDLTLVGGKEVKITFPKKWDIPRKIDEDYVYVNGEEPKRVKVSGQTVTLILSNHNDGDKELEIEFEKDAGLTNPDKDDDEYTIKVSGDFQKTEKDKDGNEVKSIVSKSYESDEFEIKKKDPPKPEQKPEPQFITKTLEVSLQVGATTGYQKNIVNGSERGNLLVFESAPYIRGGSTLVPLRFVAEGLGLHVTYDNYSRSSTVNINGRNIKLTQGSKTALIDGVAVTLPVAPEVNNGRMMVPLRFLSESFGANVGWDATTQKITITKTTVDKVDIITYAS
ncbi:stalk domain-containing protein [Brevibacillus sp. NPDC058079]|uniref:stalk domain-containing protein n=1 Tax=Brevibacillus sp. NPDC058079 TaxID=3346330 RepID=UPI0036E7441E